jgi:hypothetical protein
MRPSTSSDKGGDKVQNKQNMSTILVFVATISSQVLERSYSSNTKKSVLNTTIKGW